LSATGAPSTRVKQPSAAARVLELLDARVHRASLAALVQAALEREGKS
jgi:hypothetical protein